jgi:general secretion pathway protein D
MSQSNPELTIPRKRHSVGCRFFSVGLLGAGVLWGVVSTRTTAGEASVPSIAENEVRRREALISQSGPLLDDADRLLRENKSEEAATAYFRIYQGLPKAALADSARARARAGFATSSCHWAKKLMAEARYAEASRVLDQVLSDDVDPENAEAKKLKIQFKDSDRFPVALTPQHLSNTRKVLDLLQMAHSAYEIGDYNRSRNLYEEVLRLDSFNKTARRGLEKVEQERSRYFDAARDSKRAEAFAEVDAKWEMPLAPSQGDLSALFASGAGANTNAKTGRDEIQSKLKDLVIPKVDFSEATLEEVVEYLRVRSRDLDKTGRGVDFVVNLPENQASRQITLYLENVPLAEVVRYVTEKAAATFRVEDRAVRIISLSDNSTQLIPKTYRVPPNFIQTSVVGEEAAGGAAPADPFAQQGAGGAAPGLKIKRMGAKEFLETRGVVFKEGATASYIPSTNTLFVRNTPENIALVDSLVEQAAETAPKQVLISVKLLEVNQDNFEEFAVDIGLGAANVPGSSRVYASGGAPNNGQFEQPNIFSTTAGIRPSGALLGKATIASLIDGASTPALDSASPAAFRLLGAFTDPQFQATVRAISQKKGGDLMSVPSVITKSGVKAEINLARELIYPTEFEPPEIPQDLSTEVPVGGNVVALYGTSDFAPVTPSTPTAFDMRKVGITLEVEPVISEDGRKVDLTLLPQSTDFEGFIDYGEDINNPMRGTVLVVQNDILQPVFRTNKLSTGVTIWDGATVVLGGVMSENRSSINDKTPILGDIPILGRLWHGKINKVERKCVLFFVTVKVIDPAGQSIRQVTAAQP